MTTVSPISPQNQPGILAKGTGILAGTTVFFLSDLPNIAIKPGLLNKLSSLNNLSIDEFKAASEGLDKALKQSGLAEKGFGILKNSPKNAQQITKAIEIEFVSLANQILAKIGLDTGTNALLLKKTKTIALPEKSLILSGFHEMGHASNNAFSFIGRLLQKCRPLTKLAIPIVLISLFTTQKAPNEKPQGIIDKTTDFIRNNAGKLTFLSFLPTLIEEGMASLKAVNFAKKVLDPSLVTKVAQTNKLAYITYAGVALTTTLGVALAVKAKDMIAHPKLHKENG